MAICILSIFFFFLNLSKLEIKFCIFCVLYKFLLIKSKGHSIQNNSIQNTLWKNVFKERRQNQGRNFGLVIVLHFCEKIKFSPVTDIICIILFGRRCHPWLLPCRWKGGTPALGKHAIVCTAGVQTLVGTVSPRSIHS